MSLSSNTPGSLLLTVLRRCFWCDSVNSCVSCSVVSYLYVSFSGLINYLGWGESLFFFLLLITCIMRGGASDRLLYFIVALH